MENHQNLLRKKSPPRKANKLSGYFEFQLKTEHATPCGSIVFPPKAEWKTGILFKFHHRGRFFRTRGKRDVRNLLDMAGIRFVLLGISAVLTLMVDFVLFQVRIIDVVGRHTQDLSK